MQKRRFSRRYTRLQWSVLLLFPIVLIYYEAVFRMSTVKDMFAPGTPFLLLFSISYGMIGYLLITITNNEKANRIITSCLVGVTAVPYLVEYFVYLQFKIFYDTKTVFGGAADAVTGFTGDMFRLIFSVRGLLTILLFMLPLIFYLIFGRIVLSPRKSNMKNRIIVILLIIFVYIGSYIGVTSVKDTELMYDTQYDYQTAVSNFGLITGTRLDIKRALFGGNDKFEISQDMAQVPVLPEDDTGMVEDYEVGEAPEEEEVEEVIEYTPNVMDIDFANLQASGTHAELNAYVASLTPSMKNEYTGMFKGKNLIMISAEAFAAEAIDPVRTPTLYRMANKGIQFTDYYQPASAGTTGGEYQNIFGMSPTNGGLSFKNTHDNLNYFTMGNQLNRLGYYGQAYHNNDYTYYDRHMTHINLGYSQGFMGYGNGMEELITRQWPQSDLEMIQGTLPTYINQQPFNIYYMSVSGHSVYTMGNAMTKKHWDKVESLPYSDIVKGYLATQIEFDLAMEYLIAELEKAGIADDTVICISSDHFPYGLDSDASLGNMPYLSELYGYNVEDILQRDHNRLIIWSGCLEDMDPIIVDTPTFSLDILPTLSNLFGTEFDSRLMPGRDVFSDAPALVFTVNYQWKTEYGTYVSRKFTPTDESIELPENYVDTVAAVVRNKLTYCSGVLNSDYFRYLFGQTQ